MDDDPLRSLLRESHQALEGIFQLYGRQHVHPYYFEVRAWRQVRAALEHLRGADLSSRMTPFAGIAGTDGSAVRKTPPLPAPSMQSIPEKADMLKSSNAANHTQVSILMPAWNAQRTIGVAVRSVLRQTMPDWELLVISDDAFDYRRILPADGRIRHLSTGRTGAGPAIARNIGMDAARGDFLCALDSDDFFSRRKLEKLLPLAEKHGIAVDNSWYYHEWAAAPGFPYWPDCAGGWHPMEFFGHLNKPVWPLIRTGIARLARYPDDLFFAEDAIFNFAAMAWNDGAWLHPHPLHFYRIRRDSLSHGHDAAGRGPGERAEAAYMAILDRLLRGDPMGFPKDRLEEAVSIIQRKQTVNRNFLRSNADNFHDFDRASRD